MRQFFLYCIIAPIKTLFPKYVYLLFSFIINIFLDSVEEGLKFIRRGKNGQNNQSEDEMSDSDLDELQAQQQEDDNDDTDFYFPPSAQLPKPIKFRK